MSFTLKKVSKHYGAIPALQEVSLKLPEKGVVGLLGPNGAGKSTLMKILTGYLTQWEGSIRYKGMDFRKVFRSVQSKMGYLPENNPLYPELYVREYLHFVANLYKIQQSPVEAVMEQVGLTDYCNRKIETLSKGYKQRVGLAAALLHDPELLILDEPTTGLDPNQLVGIRALIKRLGKEKTVLLSTHILPEVESVCEYVIIINKGTIVLDGTMKSLRKGQGQILSVEFDYKVEVELLQKIPYIKKAVNMFDFQYDLYFDTDKDVRGQIFDFAKGNSLKILALHPKTQSLEEYFNNLTA